jgi:hypothetical protein
MHRPCQGDKNCDIIFCLWPMERIYIVILTAGSLILQARPTVHTAHICHVWTYFSRQNINHTELLDLSQRGSRKGISGWFNHDCAGDTPGPEFALEFALNQAPVNTKIAH